MIDNITISPELSYELLLCLGVIIGFVLLMLFGCIITDTIEKIKEKRRVWRLNLLREEIRNEKKDK